MGRSSGAGRSREGRNGIQYWRMNSPMTVPGPTRVRASLSSFDSMRCQVLLLQDDPTSPGPTSQVPSGQLVSGCKVLALEASRVRFYAVTAAERPSAMKCQVVDRIAR